MIISIELQVISRLLASDDDLEINTLCEYGPEYYATFQEHIKFILDHKDKYGVTPDPFTFQARFPKCSLVDVHETLDYLVENLKKNRQYILLTETFNKIKDLGIADVTEAWQYLQNQCDIASQLEAVQPLDLIKDADKRAQQVLEFSKQARIPTGFAEIDKLMYGGLSTVEELLLIIARTNTGKSWLCTRMMESAQKHNFPVLYYSPEMQGSLLGTRFDTWRTHIQNSQLFQGKYNENYYEYLANLKIEDTSAFVLEDKDMPSGEVNCRNLEAIVRRQHIKLLIIDGLSYMTDTKRSETDHIKFKNICTDLFRLSKKYGCAVVVAVQANRETRECRDDKGEPFPGLYNVESSDHPGRICTQAFAVRQVFDKHVLDIRLEKSRNANNQKPTFSYSWDINTGNVQYLPGSNDSANTPAPVSPVTVSPVITTHVQSDDAILTEDDFDEDVEF